MKHFVLRNIKKIYENRATLEKKLKVKTEIAGRKLTINGNEIDEFLATQVIDSIELGFDVETALLLVNPDYLFEKLQIKNFTKRKNLVEVRALVIGKDGRTKSLVEELSDCFISVHESEVGIIGEVEKIKSAIHAVTMLIQGSKQSSVYAYLEKQRKIVHPSDLGLKIKE